MIQVVPAPLRFALLGLGLLVGLLALRGRHLERQREGLTSDVGLLQSALLPELPRRVGDTWVSAAYRPAEGLAAGGDFYDAFPLPGRRTCVIVGDVAGHGRDAIPLTADVRFTLRAYLEGGLGARAALQAAAEVLEPRLHGRHVTVIVGVYDARSGRLTYVAAGHPPPLLSGVQQRLVTRGGCPPLGAGLPTGRRQTTLPLPPGAIACFHTDGLADVRTGRHRLGADGLAAAVGAESDARALLARLVELSDEQPDDMAACILQPRPAAPAADGARVEELELRDAADAPQALRLLAACGVPAADAAATVAAVRDALPVVLEVRCGEGAAAVAVHRPEPAVLPVA